MGSSHGNIPDNIDHQSSNPDNEIQDGDEYKNVTKPMSFEPKSPRYISFPLIIYFTFL